MKPKVIFALLFGTFVAIGCRDSPSDPVQSSSVPAGAFQYTGYDGTGRITETGWLTIVVRDSSIVSGMWRFAAEGSGELRGSISNGRIAVDLHPEMADNNFLLNGTVESKTFRGNWEKIGITGVMASGTFLAYQQ
jgi:hypothetical protein